MSLQALMPKLNFGGKKELYDWRFEVETQSEYVLTLTIHTKKRFKRVFEAVKTTLRERHKAAYNNPDFDPEALGKVEIEQRFFKLLRVMVAPFFKDRSLYLLKREKKPVYLLDYGIKKAWFEKKGRDWLMIIQLKGYFKDGTE